MRTIQAAAGAIEYVGGTVTEVNGKDITGATFQVALATSGQVPPSVWIAPSSSVQGPTTADRIVKLLVSSSTPAGTYWCWVKVSDAPEVVPRVLDGPFAVV